MQPTSLNKVRVEEAKTIIKTEPEQKSVPHQSTIAQFFKSGQAAFGQVDTNFLGKRNEISSEVQKWMLEQVRERLAAATDLYHDDVLILRPLLKLEYVPNVTGFQCLYPELSRLMRSNLTYAVAFTNCVLEASTNQVPRAIKDNLLRNVAQDMGTVSIDMREHEAFACQLATADQKQSGDIAEPQPLAKLSPAGLGLFTKHCYGSGFYKSVESMLRHLESEMSRALVMDLHKIYVPFLQELIGLMLMYGIPMTDTIYSGFFESVLQNYHKRFVGQEIKNDKSIEHRSWTLRANAARATLRSFEHTYFRAILGDRYDTIVLPILTGP